MPKLYIVMDLRQATHSMRSKPAEERRVELGPFTQIRNIGVSDGSIYAVVEGHEAPINTGLSAEVGHGGYCDTCAYNYVGWRFLASDPDVPGHPADLKGEWEVMGWRIESR